MEILPNPSTGIFSVSFSDLIRKGKFELLFMYGEKILEEKIINSSQKDFNLKTSALEFIF